MNRIEFTTHQRKLDVNSNWGYCFQLMNIAFFRFRNSNPFFDCIIELYCSRVVNSIGLSPILKWATAQTGQAFKAQFTGLEPLGRKSSALAQADGGGTDEDGNGSDGLRRGRVVRGAPRRHGDPILGFWGSRGGVELGWRRQWHTTGA